MHRLAVILLAACALASAHAQEFAALLARGPVPYLQGPAVVLTQGNLTAGDGADLTCADYDRDGLTDVLLGSSCGDLVYYHRLPTGFDKPVVMLTATLAFAKDQRSRAQVSPELGDLDGDGIADLLLGAGSEIYHYHRTATGMDAGVPLPLAGDRTVGQALGTSRPAPSLADFDGDADLDLLVGDDAGRVWWVEHLPGPGLKFAEPSLLGVAGQPLQAGPRSRICAGDWDRDGCDDVIVGDANGQLSWSRGRPQGLLPLKPLLTAPLTPLPGQPCYDLCPRLSDVDGDKRPELLVGTRQGFVAVFNYTDQGPAFGGFLQARDVPLDVGRYAAPTLVDWNADGVSDLLCGAEDGLLRLFLGRRDGRFEAGQLVGGANGNILAEGGLGPGRFSWPRMADLNGDGVADLLLGGASGRVAVFLNQGTLNSVGVLKIGGAPITARGISAVCLSDYDGDGDLDLFLGDLPPPDAISPTATAAPRFALPPGGISYYENEAPKGGGLPVLLKGVRLTLYVGRTDRQQEDAALDASVLGPYYLEPVAVRDDAWSFLAVARAGCYMFRSAKSRQYYPLPMIQAPRGLQPAPLFPPLYSCTVARDARGTGLLCGLSDYGFVCYYPPDQVPQITGGG